MTNDEFFEKTKGKLIVSCQALPEEPLHSSYIMSRMAYAAYCGGASGIRCNTVADIKEIKKTVSLPLIGIIKQVYEDSPVYITPTMQEVDALMQEGVEVIAMDATDRPRTGGRSLDEIFGQVREKYPNQLFMADCACYEDALHAVDLGFDIIGTTMVGCTEKTAGTPAPNFDLIEKLCALHLEQQKIIVEGGIWSPQTLARVLQYPGVHAAVVGSAITRPMEITKRYVQAIAQDNPNRR